MTESPQTTASAENEVGFQLSDQQERLWVLFGEAMPQAQRVFDLAGTLDEDAVREALEAAVGRHEILRTSFVRPAGLRVPLQVVQEQGSLAWASADLTGQAGAALEQRLAELKREQLEAAVDLERGPLLKAALLSTDSGQLLVLTAPRIVLDARSLELLAREALPGAPVDDEPLQYGDYAAWQLEQRDGADAEPAVGQDDAPPTSLPLIEVPESPAGESDEIEVPVSADAAAAVEGLSADPREAWLAVWSVLVARLSGRPDVTVDVSVDGRAQDELAGALGPFARPVPVAVEVDPETSLKDVVVGVARELSAAERDQDRRQANGAAATAVGFSLSTEPQPLEVAGVKATPLDSTGAGDFLQVGLEVRSRSGGVVLCLRFPTGTGAEAAQALADNLQSLVAAVAEKGGPGSVRQLDVLTAEQRRHLLEELSGAGSPAQGGDARVHWQIEETAARAGDAAAVSLGDERLSYAELNERANRLAHALRAKGVGPGTTVAILLDRSLELIVSVLAVMKSGGAYLPLNPDHPTERLNFQLQDAAASLVLTDAALAEQAGQLSGTPIRVDEAFEAEPAENPERVGDADDVAYVIYTSGSTGVPKGVEVTHRGLASYLAAVVDRIGLDGEGPLRFGVVTTMSTDLGNTSVFAALATGGCLELVPVDAAMDGEAFAAHLADRPLDVLKITPSHLAALLVSSASGVLPRRTLVLGGEAAPWQLVEQIRAQGSCRIVNHYGPTETTIGSLTHDLGDSSEGAPVAATVPIGRPLAGTRIYVVDEDLRPVPVGTPGELLIGGPGLARGYRNQAEQTAERFVADPFSDDPEARVYRTGDVVCFLSDGSVEFLGRADGQVKIRGFRVELTEVEAVLSGHPAASQVAVVMREDGGGDGRLVAYVVGGASTEDLRSLASERLPDYMVPSAFVTLAALPLTPNGKLDRAALPAPDVGVSSSREYVAPSTEIEERLAAIWAESLEVERVGVQDDFFELGGHSLLAAQVIARIRSAYDVQLPLHSLFTAPRIADLAAEVEAARVPSEEEDSELTSLLEDLEGLTDEEAERLLQLETSEGEGQPADGPE